jgi:hypothetical protein
MKDGSAWTLNARKPVEKPQTHRAGDVKNHLAKLDLPVVLCRVHVVSLTLVDRFPIPMLKLSTRVRTPGDRDGKKLENVRHYSFGRYGCQYNFGRLPYSLLL